MYEGYGPGGVALMIQTVTDNPTRTVAEVRHTTLARRRQPRRQQLGRLDVRPQGPDLRRRRRARRGRAAWRRALDAGAEDVRREDDQFVVTTDAGRPCTPCAPRSRPRELRVAESEIAWLPKTTVRVEGKTAESLVKLLEELEDLDDVQKVDANFDMDVADMARA